MRIMFLEASQSIRDRPCSPQLEVLQVDQATQLSTICRGPRLVACRLLSSFKSVTNPQRHVNRSNIHDLKESSTNSSSAKYVLLTLFSILGFGLTWLGLALYTLSQPF